MNRTSLAHWCWLLATVSGCQDGGQAAPADAPQLCTAVGCGPAADFTLPYAGNDADLVDGTGRVCVNDSCAEATIPAVPPLNDTAIGNGFRAGDLIGSIFIWRINGALSVRGMVNPYTLALMPGDIYSLRYSAQDGRVLLEGRWIAREYATSYPNGVECGPACFSAKLEVLSP